LGESFWMHRTAPGSPALIHASTSRRAEIVLFGDDVALVPPFAFHCGEFTITAPRGDNRCTLSRLSVRHGANRRQCSLHVEDVLRQLADLGVTYPEVVELLRQAGKFGCLSSALAVDALPQATSVYDLARNGANQPELLQANQEGPKVSHMTGETPTLYEKATDRKLEFYPVRELKAKAAE